MNDLYRRWRTDLKVEQDTLTNRTYTDSGIEVVRKSFPLPYGIELEQLNEIASALGAVEKTYGLGNLAVCSADEHADANGQYNWTIDVEILGYSEPVIERNRLNEFHFEAHERTDIVTEDGHLHVEYTKEEDRDSFYKGKNNLFSFYYAAFPNRDSIDNELLIDFSINTRGALCIHKDDRDLWI